MRKQTAVGAVLMGLALGAQAEGGYIGLGLGASRISIEDVNIPGLSENKDESGFAFKVFGGYEYSKHIAVELGYMNLGEASQSVSSGVNRLAAKVEGTAIYLDVIGKAAVTGEVSLFGKLGLASTKAKLKVTEASGAFSGCCSNDSESEINPRFGFGVEIGAGPSALRLEYERVMKVGADDTTGESDVDFFGLSSVVRF
jgi:OmpA-OmpF porin, OOP family